METTVEGVTAKVESLLVHDKADDGNLEKEKVAVKVEPKTGVSFPVKLDDGKQLICVGLRKKSVPGIGIKIYAFGIYADNENLKDLLRSMVGELPPKPTKEMYQVVVDCDVEMTVRMVILFPSLDMNMVRKNFDEVLGASIKKITGEKKNEITKKAMGQASDNIKLPSGSVIAISRLPGYIFQTKDDVFDKDGKEKVGMSLLSLF
ncbi:hypothetical protein Ddye_000236 [Dipteronia dyeriana]|uniref:Chalcone isomerase n=1 Tax=Dipteronia dyeriana TaxID=168575 RepID=A0AAE0CSC4_9ROSI|nr:hypothetical protein Ddye_000236 [Dipteronia dyeriana]